MFILRWPECFLTQMSPETPVDGAIRGTRERRGCGQGWRKPTGVKVAMWAFALLCTKSLARNASWSRAADRPVPALTTELGHGWLQLRSPEVGGTWPGGGWVGGGLQQEGRQRAELGAAVTPEASGRQGQVGAESSHEWLWWKRNAERRPWHKGRETS